MEIIKNKNRTRLVKAAMGEIPCDLSLENVILVNVITEEIYPVEGIDIIDGVIARIRKQGEKCEIPSCKTIDCHSAYIAPGFIDTHMHVESTMMVPENFGKAAVVWGTTTAVTDPHEIANVAGITGVTYMLHSARKSPLRIFTLAPSCVPAVPSVESAGATFLADEIKTLLKEEEVIGIAEVMDYNGVIHDDSRMHTIIDAGKAANGFIQGHAPYVRGKELCAYLNGGPVSDHEVRVAEELIEKLQLGMHVNIKSSSLSDTVHEFLKGIKNVKGRDLVSLCTDDVHAADLLKTGHINHIANICVENDIDSIEAARFGTYNAAKELHFDDLGAIAPGYVADLQVLTDLNFDKPPKQVYIEGKLIVEDGKLLEGEATIASQPNVNTVNIPQIKSADDFGIKCDNEAIKHLIFSASRASMRPGQEAKYESFPINNGKIVIPLEKYQFLSIVNRYGSGDITTVVCSDFSLKHGCVASTISHDSHNMTLVYRDPYDAYVAAKELERIGGGMCFIENGEVKWSLPLPVGGLMSPLPADKLTTQIQVMDQWVKYATEGESPMLLAIAILALPVRPGIIITDKGVVRGETLKFIPTEVSL